MKYRYVISLLLLLQEGGDLVSNLPQYNAVAQQKGFQNLLNKLEKDDRQGGDEDQVINQTARLKKTQEKWLKLRLKQQKHVEAGIASSPKARELKFEEETLVREVIEQYNLNDYIDDFESISRLEDDSQLVETAILDKYGQMLDILKDFYFEYSQ